MLHRRERGRYRWVDSERVDVAVSLWHLSCSLSLSLSISLSLSLSFDLYVISMYIFHYLSLFLSISLFIYTYILSRSSSTFSSSSVFRPGSIHNKLSGFEGERRTPPPSLPAPKTMARDPGKYCEYRPQICVRYALRPRDLSLVGNRSSGLLGMNLRERLGDFEDFRFEDVGYCGGGWIRQ